MPWYRPLLYVWASPATLIGLSVIPVALFQDTHFRLVRGAFGNTWRHCNLSSKPWASLGRRRSRDHFRPRHLGARCELLGFEP